MPYASPMDMNGAEPDRLADTAARLRTLLTMLVIMLALVLAAERAAYAGLFRSHGVAPGELAIALLFQLVLAAPAALYLAALWQLRQAAAAAARGTTFGPAVVHSLRRVGYCLIVGAALALLGMPLLHRITGAERTRLIDYDVATLIIAGIGLGLVFLARLVRRAAAVEAELEQIF